MSELKTYATFYDGKRKHFFGVDYEIVGLKNIVRDVIRPLLIGAGFDLALVDQYLVTEWRQGNEE